MNFDTIQATNLNWYVLCSPYIVEGVGIHLGGWCTESEALGHWHAQGFDGKGKVHTRKAHCRSEPKKSI